MLSTTRRSVLQSHFAIWFDGRARLTAWGVVEVGGMNERAVVLNGLAQGIRPLEQSIDWFESLADAGQFEVLRDLAGFCIQARALM